MELDVATALKVLWFTPTDSGWGVPLLFWGHPGTAKTRMISEAASAYGFPCKALSPAKHGQGIFGVTPVPYQDAKGSTRIGYPAPAWTDEFTDGGVVFLDELGSVAPSLQPPLLGLLQDREIGDHRLPRRVRMVAAANPPESAASGWDLAAPAANRLAHFDWATPGVPEWGSHMAHVTPGVWDDAPRAERPKNGKGTPDPQAGARELEKLVLAGWEAAYPRVQGLVVGFLRARPGLLHKMPPAESPQLGRAWPSPRTWDLLTRALTVAEILGEHSARGVIAASLVGEGVAAEFMGFARTADLPDPTKLLDGEEAFTHDPGRLDRTLVALSACVAVLIPQHPKRTARAATLWKLLAKIADTSADLLVPFVNTLQKEGLGLSQATMSSDIGKNAGAALKKLFEIQQVAK